MSGRSVLAVPLLMLTASTLVAQPTDSLRAVANDVTRDHGARVMALRMLDGTIAPTAAEFSSEPSVRALLADTVLTNSDGAWAWLLQGMALVKRGLFTASASACDSAMRASIIPNDGRVVAMARLDKGRALNMTGDQAAAMRMYFSALELLREEGLRWEEANALLYLAWIFDFQNDRDKSWEYTQQGMAIARAIGAESLMADAFRVEGDIMLEQHREHEAMDRYQQAHDIYARLGNRNRVAVTSTQLANVRAELGDMRGAQAAFTEALAAFEATGNQVWISYLHSRLAHTNHELHADRAALRHAERGLAVAEEHGLLKETVDNLAMLHEAYAALGDYANALRASQRLELMHDSLVHNSIAVEMGQLDMRQEQVRDSLLRAQQNLRETSAHQATVLKATQQRNIFLFAGIGLLIVSVGLWNRLRYAARVKHEFAEGNLRIEEEKLRAERSEKVKEQFLANMSHEIRTPMNAIMGMTGILKRNERLPEQEKYLSAISQSSENLLVILNDILDLDRLEAGNVELEKLAFSPAGVVANVLDILRFKAEEKGLHIGSRVADDAPPQVIGDPTRLHQVLLNLAGNAIKFTERGGVNIDLAVEEREADRITLRFAVSDSGIGIDVEKLDVIFEEFTQAYSDTTRKYGGTGLGLTISKRFVELQGGTIIAESEKEKGSTFTVRIPYAVAASAGMEDPYRRRISGPDELRDIKILLAEDNDFNVMVAQDELADAIPGVKVDVAANGRIAVEMVQANTYDVVLMDIQMPEMNGFDATRAIRALPGGKARIPIVAISANVLKSEVDKCMEAGMVGFVPKPFTRGQLMEELGRAMAQRITPA